MQLSQSKKKTYMIFGMIAIAGLLAYMFTSGGVPHIIIDEDPIIDDPTAKIATGSVEYVVTLNFSDGSKKVFRETVPFADIPLQSITAGGATLTSITAEAFAKINVPAGLDDSVKKTVYIESTPELRLNDSVIGAHSTNTFWGFSQLGQPVKLYEFTVPASQVKLPTGTYTLSLRSIDQIRFVVNGENRIMKIDVTPTFGMANENGILKELYVVTYSPTAVAQLDRIPLYRSDGSVGSYNSTAVIKASHFKPFTDLRFTYVDRSVSAASKDPSNTHYSPLLAKGQSVIKSDLTGSAKDVFVIKVGYSSPDPERYYAHFIVDDGESYAFGMSGTSWRVDSGRGENPAFYVWPPCIAGTNPCTINWDLVNQMIASKGGHYPT